MFIGKVYVPLVHSSGTSISGEMPFMMYILLVLLGLVCIGLGAAIFKTAWDDYDIAVKIVLFPGSILVFMLGLSMIIAPFIGG